MAITMCLDTKTCTSEIKNSSQACPSPTVTHIGRVVRLRERNGYHDSDFYALVWHGVDAEHPVEEICYGSTSSWTYHNHASVDASPEIMAEYKTWEAERWQAAYAARVEAERLQAEREPSKGKHVRSLTTRGKNVGVEGVVRWYGASNYGGMRVGIKIEGQSTLVYMDASRVEVIPPVDNDLSNGAH